MSHVEHVAEARERDTGMLRERGESRSQIEDAESDADELREKWTRATVVKVVTREIKADR